VFVDIAKCTVPYDPLPRTWTLNHFMGVTNE